MRMKAVAGPVVKRMLVLCHHGKSPTRQVTVSLGLFSRLPNGEWLGHRERRGHHQNTVITTPGDSLSLLSRQLISIPEKQAKHIACMEDRLVLYLTLVFGSFSHSLRLNTGSFILFAYWPRPQE